MTEIYVPAFTQTCLLITAVLCIVAVLAGWYTVRGRIQLSQVILGVFCYVVVMLLENYIYSALGSLGAAGGVAYAVILTLALVLAREIVRYAAVRYGLKSNFDSTDSAIGYAIGFAGLYLLVCAFYYFNCYTVALEYTRSGAEAFLADAATDAEEAQELLVFLAGQSGWQFVLTGVNRVFFLVREAALSVLLWYALKEDGEKWLFGLVPALHFLALLPEGFYQAGLLADTYVRDIATCVISAGIAFLAVQMYNRREDLVSHFKVEKLRARRRR